MPATAQQKSLVRQVKSALALRGETLAELAAALNANRVSVSRAINHPPRNRELAQRIRKHLNLL